MLCTIQINRLVNNQYLQQIEQISFLTKKPLSPSHVWHQKAFIDTVDWTYQVEV